MLQYLYCLRPLDLEREALIPYYSTYCSRPLDWSVRQANETREGLKQKLELRRQVLADADRINEVVASLDESGDLEPRGAGQGIAAQRHCAARG